ncbi:MAG TPA: ABC transporter permease [Vicinamibacterales bacterium]|nr:ABC transporter permease [Vicinamibacterales bacterium]
MISALRALARTPVMAMVVVLSLGIGIGVNTVVFSWIQALVFRPIPGVADASSFHLIETRGEGHVRPGSSWQEYLDLKRQVPSLDNLLAFRMVPLNVGTPPRTERTYALLVSGNYFDALGLRPARGRFLRPDEVRAAGREPVAVVSHDYWLTRLGGSSDVVGRTLRVNDAELSIVGVAPEGFLGTVLGLQFDMWVPATLAPVLLGGSPELDDRSIRGYYAMGTLESDATARTAQAEVAAAMQRLSQEFPATNTGMTAEVLPFWRASRGPQGLLLQGLAVLQAVMLLLLLAVCGNTANLVLARASTRVKDIAVRLAVGAGSWRIARLLLVENLMLGLLGASLGALIAWWGSNALRAVPFTAQFPVRFHTELNGAGLAFAMALGVLCALVFGAAPALQLARLSPQLVMRHGGGTPAHRRLRGLLMGAQVALAMMVLVAAALFFQSFRETQDVNPGFRTEGILLAGYDPGRPVDDDRARQFADDLLSRLRALPDVEAAAIALSMPLDIHGLPVRSFVIEGRARTDGSRDRAVSNVVTPGYFETMGIPFLAGGDFAGLSDKSAPRQAIVNAAFVTRLLDGGEALGRQLWFGDSVHTIVGIVRTSLSDSFSEPPTPAVYLSYRDRPSRIGEIHVRTALGDETLLVPAIRRVVESVDPSIPLYNVRTMTEHIDMNLALRKIPARMFVVLGPLILMLAAIGIYAVVAYNVSQRTAEIGVRMALGASGRAVRRQIVGEGLKVVAIGAIIGWLPAAFLYTHLMRGRLDAPVFGGVPLVLLALAAVACWAPARRASRVDPVIALRE